MAKYRVLSIDGGGIRGIISTIILQRLGAEPQLADWLDKADLLVGTSTGGLIALSVAHGLPLTTIRSLYESKGERIFDDSWFDDLIDLGTIAGAEYDIDNLATELRAVFGTTTTLGDLHRAVLVTAFDLDNGGPDGSRRWKPKLFHNIPGSDSDGAALVYKVGLYTSAAPTYFPSVDGFVDGGVYAGNPAMCALSQTQDSRNAHPHRPALSDVVLLSLGTGTSLVHIEGQELDWGYAQWVKPLITLMLDGVTDIADYQCRQILGPRYHRRAPIFPAGKSIPMDDWEQVPYMVDFAARIDLTETIAWLRAYWA
jgi:Patatin-like phospholipase